MTTAETKQAVAATEVIDGVEYTRDMDTDELFVVPEGSTHIRIVRSEFGGVYGGVVFHVPQWVGESDEDKVAALQAAIEKYGVERILDGLNDSLASSIKNRVRTAILKPDDKSLLRAAIVKLVEKEPVQFTIEDAAKFMPGEKALTLTGMLNKARKLFNEAKKETDREKARALKAEAGALIVKFQELQLRELEMEDLQND